MSVDKNMSDNSVTYYLCTQDSRTDILQRLAEKETLNAELQRDLEKYRECDPEVLEEVKAQTVVAKEAANRWTG